MSTVESPSINSTSSGPIPAFSSQLEASTSTSTSEHAISPATLTEVVVQPEGTPLPEKTTEKTTEKTKGKSIVEKSSGEKPTQRRKESTMLEGSPSIINIIPVAAPVKPPQNPPDNHRRIYKTPGETTMWLIDQAKCKAANPLHNLVILSLLSGLYVSFAGIFAIFISKGSPTLPDGIQRLLFGLGFQSGLVYMIVMGAELFTGNTMIMTLGLINHSVTPKEYAKVLVVSFFGNFLGCAIGAIFFGYFTELFIHEPYLSGVKAITEIKLALPPHVVFLRAIGANWLVNIGLFMAAAADSIEGKALAAALPVTSFTASSLEHCVANMFFVPLGLIYGADSDFGTFLYRNLILVVLGNWIGGALGVGTTAWLLYVKHFEHHKNENKIK